jgi:hypothetical protein
MKFFLNALCIQAENNIKKVRSMIDLYDDMKQKFLDVTRSEFATKVLDKAVVSGDVVNDGKILIRHKHRAGDGTEYQDLRGRRYRASSDAVLRYEQGAHSLFSDYMNNGLLYSPTRFKIIQHGTVTKWGRAVAEDGIEYEIDGTPLITGMPT